MKSSFLSKRLPKKILAGLLSVSILSSLAVPTAAAAEDEVSLTRLPGVVATASNSRGVFTPDKAIDGKISRDKESWSSDNKARPPEWWLKIDLGSVQTISKYVIIHAGVDGGKQLNPRDFTVSVSADDVEWTVVDEVIGNVFNVTQSTFDPVSARYVRVDYTDPEQRYPGQAGNARRARVYEIELYENADAVSKLYSSEVSVELPDRTDIYTGSPLPMSGATCDFAHYTEILPLPLKYLYKAHGSDGEWSETTPINPGEYDVKAVFEGNGAYQACESNTALFTIAKCPISINLDSKSAVYTGNPIDMTGAITYPNKVPVSYQYKNPATEQWSDTAPTEVGKYTVKAVYAGNNEHLEAESEETTLSITPVSKQSNWDEIQEVLSGIDGKLLKEFSSAYHNRKFMEIGMVMGNGTFGVVSDARRNEQSYYLTSGDAWVYPADNAEKKIMNAQVKITNAEESKPKPYPPAQFSFKSSNEDKSAGPGEYITHVPPAGAFDSDEDTMWQSYSQKISVSGEERGKEKWVSVTGRNSFTFDKIEIKLNSVRFPDEAIYNLFDYEIQVSDDEVNWNTIKSVKGNTEGINTFTFEEPITCKHLRVFSTNPVAPEYASKHMQDDMTRARITDIDIYNDDANVINPPPEEYDGRYLHERDILNAEIRSKMEFNDNLVECQTWVADDQNAMFTELSLDSAATSEQKVKIELTHPEMMEALEGLNNQKGTEGDVLWLTRNWEEGFIFRGATTARVVEGNYTMQENAIEVTLQPGEKAKLATVLYTHSGLKVKSGEGSILVSKEVDQVREIAIDRANALTVESIAQSYDHHRNWWKDYWLKSYIKTDDPVITDYYFTSLYILGCTIRETPDWAEQPNVPSGLCGLFSVGDYSKGIGVLNYNYESPHYGLHSSNRSDMLQPYYLETFNRATHTQNEVADAGYKGTQVDRRIIPVWAFYGTMPYKEPAAEKGRLTSDQKSNMALYSRHLVWNWQYTHDVNDLRDYVYPTIKMVAEFYVDFVVKGEDGKYWVYDSANNEAGSDINPSLDIGYIRATLTDYVEMAEYLNQDSDFVAQCNDVLENLSPLPTSQGSEVTKAKLADLGFKWDKNIIVAGVEANNQVQVNAYDYPWAAYISENNQPVVLEGAVHPGETISLASDPESLQLARDTFEYLNPLTPHTNGAGVNGFTKSFTIGARLGVDADNLMHRFRTTLKTLHNKDTNMYLSGHSYESCGSIESVNSMLLQNELDELRLFPAWTKKQDAKFVTLRAKGGLRVSSEMKDGQVQWAEIISDAGEEVTLVAPWEGDIKVTDENGQNVEVTKVTTKNTNETAYRFNTRVHGVYTVENASDETPTVTGIAITKAPAKTDYMLGEELDLTGMEVTATYSDGSTKALAAGEYTVSGYNKDQAGSQTVTVSYKENATMTATFDVVVTETEKDVKMIKITTPPSKMVYKLGEELDLTGMVVTATYTDGSTKILTADEYSVVGYNKDKAGSQDVQIVYTSGNFTRKATMVITVEAGSELPDTMWRKLLKQTIDAAEEAAQNLPEHIIPSVQEKFEAALEAAWKAYNNAEATDAELMAADELLITMLHYLSFTADKSGLEAAVNEADTIIASGEYLEDDAFKAYEVLRDEAKEMLLDDKVTDTELGQKVAQLAEAKAKLNKKPIVTLDLAVLEHQIDLAKLINLDDYLDLPANAIFTEAFEAAKALLEDAKLDGTAVTQEAIDAAAKNLHDARMKLRMKPSKDALEQLLSEANTFDMTKYSEASGARLTAAIEEATQVYNNPQASEQAVKLAEDALLYAMENMEPIQSGDDTEDPDDSSKPDDSAEPDDDSGSTPSGGKNTQTGDSAVWPVGGLLAASLLGIAAITFLKKKSTERK